MMPTILIVDDENDLREAIAFDFRRKNFRVLMAACGNEAIKIVESEKVDIVLTDVRMPNGDGVELLDKIKERNAFLPVVMFITGYADITLEVAYDKGADAVFAKPFDRNILMSTVQRAIQPADQRLIRKSTRVDIEVPIGLKFLNSKISVEAKARNFARGGMFVALDANFPEALEETEFRMSSTVNPGVMVAGRGIVRWVRSKAGEPMPTGCGIEFLGLEEECKLQVIDMINFLKTKSFIPRK